MSSHASHTIHRGHHHIGWDNALPPVMTIAPGTTLTFDCQDASGGQLTSASTVADVV
jgi:acetamidase/formamidase